MSEQHEELSGVDRSVSYSSYWLKFLTDFPFVFFPIVAIIGIICSIIMPIVTGAHSY